MKHAKLVVLALLLVSLLLSSCGQLPAPAADSAAEELSAPADGAWSLEPLAAHYDAPAPTRVTTDLFSAKFEGSAVSGSGAVIDGVYRFIAEETDGEAWHVKLESNYPTVAGRDYRVTYRFTSSVAGKIKFGDFQEFEIQEGENTVTGMMIANGGTSYLDLQLGMLDPFTIDFKEIEVEEYADEVDYRDALSVPVNFEKELKVYEKHDQGYGTILTRSSDEVSNVKVEEITYAIEQTPETKAVTVLWTHDDYKHTTLETAPDKATVRIGKIPAEGREPWKTKLFVYTGVKLKAGEKYRVSMLVKSIIPAPFEVCFNNGEEEKGLGAMFGLISTPTGQYVEYVTYAKQDTDLVVQLSLGTCSPPNSIILDKFSVTKAGTVNLVSDTIYSF